MAEPFVRTIYLYRWALTNRPFYVGSTWDIKKRDQYHRKGYNNTGAVAADAILGSYGAALTLEQIDKVTGSDKTIVSKQAKILENKYILEHNTLVQHGGGNKTLNAVRDEFVPKAIQVSTYMPAEVAQELKRLAELNGQNIAEFIRSIMLEFLARQLPKI